MRYKEGLLKETAPHENPLIPNKKLREMYVAMVEMRVWGEHVAKVLGRVKPKQRLLSLRGEEACRVSTAIDLGPGDLVSDSQAGVAMEYLLGAKIGPLLERVAAQTGKGKDSKVAGDGDGTVRLLPWVADVEDRLRMAMGAALSFRTLKQLSLVVAYVREGELTRGRWRKILELAARLELPILFVVLPDGSRRKRTKRNEIGALSSVARLCGVPGIPVDASDAVAVYRVTQESIGRFKGGGGPVLVECVAYRLKGTAVSEVVDPVDQMRGFLLGRKVSSKAWLEHADGALKGRMAKASKNLSRN